MLDLVTLGEINNFADMQTYHYGWYLSLGHNIEMHPDMSIHPVFGSKQYVHTPPFLANVIIVSDTAFAKISSFGLRPLSYVFAICDVNINSCQETK